MPDEKNEYNKSFAIPEMIKTFRGVSKKIQRDAFFIIIISIYLILNKCFLITEIKIPGIDFSFKYEGGYILVVLVIFLFFAFSLSTHLFKIVILFRQIDDELKRFYTGTGKDILDQVLSARNMTAFVLSDNFFTDVILTGKKRIPSLLRIICLQIALLGLIGSFLNIMLIDYYSDFPYCYYMLFFKIIANLGIYAIFLIFTYSLLVKRSAFLFLCEESTNVIIGFHNLLDSIAKAYQKLSNLTANNNLNIEKSKFNKLNNEFTKIKNKFSGIRFQNIFDNSKYFDDIYEGLDGLKDIYSKFDKREQKRIEEELNKGRQNLPSMQSPKVMIENYIKNYIEIGNMSNYKLLLKFHNADIMNLKIYRVFRKILKKAGISPGIK